MNRIRAGKARLADHAQQPLSKCGVLRPRLADDKRIWFPAAMEGT